jgi:hypothetical protein
MRVDLLAQYLESKGLGEIGLTIFAHRMPNDCKTGIVVKFSHVGVKVNRNLPGYYRTSDLQVIVRSPDQQSGDRLAKQVSDTLTLYNTDFADGSTVVMTIKQMFPLHLPIVYPRLNGEELEFSINFDTTYIWNGSVEAT